MFTLPSLHWQLLKERSVWDGLVVVFQKEDWYLDDDSNSLSSIKSPFGILSH